MTNSCPDCGSDFFGYKCKCGYRFKNKTKQNISPEKERVPAYFVEQFEDDKLTKPIYGKIYIQKCEFSGCLSPGTMTHSTGHDSSESASWYCRHHWR